MNNDEIDLTLNLEKGYAKKVSVGLSQAPEVRNHCDADDSEACCQCTFD